MFDDYGAIVAMLKKADIKYYENEEDGSQPLSNIICRNIFVYVDDQKDEETKHRIGYSGFCTEIVFDENGNLVGIGAWE